MSLLSYQLQTKRYQRELEIDHRTFNALDRKHGDINLLKQLQLLNPKMSAPTPAPAPPEEEEPSGFWGHFVLVNETAAGSNHRHLDAYLAYNDVPLTSSQQINGDANYTFNITEADRLPLPSSTLQLKLTMQNETQGVDIGEYYGFTITGFTTNPLDEENTMSMLVDNENYDDGECGLTILAIYVPPGQQGWSGTITFVKEAGGGQQQFFTIKTETEFIVTDYLYNSGSNVFSVSLASPSSYLYLSMYGAGSWEITNNSFSQDVGEPTYVSENNRGWERYTISSEFEDLTYNFSTYYND